MGEVTEALSIPDPPRYAAKVTSREVAIGIWLMICVAGRERIVGGGGPHVRGGCNRCATSGAGPAPRPAWE